MHYSQICRRSLPSTEAEYKVLANATAKMMWGIKIVDGTEGSTSTGCSTLV
jgi:hypothetical protein